MADKKEGDKIVDKKNAEDKTKANEKLSKSKKKTSRNISSQEMVVLVFVLIALFVVAAVLYNSKNSDSETHETAEQTYTVSYLSNISDLEKQISEADSSDKTLMSDLNSQLADFYYSEGDAQKALSIYKSAIADYGELNAFSYVSTAAIAEELGDKDLAIEYYQAAIEVFPENDPLKEATIIEYNSYIEALR